MVLSSGNIFIIKNGINLEIVTGRGAEMGAKILQERARGLYLADVVILGMNTIYRPIKASCATDPEMEWERVLQGSCQDKATWNKIFSRPK